MIAMIAAALALAPAKPWRYELVSVHGTGTFSLAAMPKDVAVKAPTFVVSGWRGREVESIVLDPLAREGRTVTVRFKDVERPIVFVFESFDVTTQNVKPRGTRVGLRCTMAVSRP